MARAADRAEATVTAVNGRHGWTWVGAAALIAVLLIAVAVAMRSTPDSSDGSRAILFAAGLALAGSLGGWIVGRLRPTEPARAVAVGLAAVGLRLLPMLATLAWLQAAGGRPGEGGAVEWLVRFYLCLLATDVLLHMMEPGAGRRAGKSPQN